MWQQPENDQFVDELFLAGEHVPSGVYRQIGSGREVLLERDDDVLPGSLDGRVACYMRVHSQWGQTEAPRQAA